MTLQLHAHFIPTYSIQLTRFSKGGYKSNDVNSPVLSWMETKSSVKITKFPGYEGKPTFFTHILADLAFFRKSLCIFIFDLVFWLNQWSYTFEGELLNFPPSPQKLCNHNFFSFFGGGEGVEKVKLAISQILIFFRLAALQKSFLRHLLCWYHLIPCRFLQGLGRRIDRGC